MLIKSMHKNFRSSCYNMIPQIINSMSVINITHMPKVKRKFSYIIFSSELFPLSLKSFF